MALPGAIAETICAKRLTEVDVAAGIMMMSERNAATSHTGPSPGARGSASTAYSCQDYGRDPQCMIPIPSRLPIADWENFAARRVESVWLAETGAAPENR
eukprot:COSAG01_NODE_22076_length_872_cov_3.119017_2_plen_99_part_01